MPLKTTMLSFALASALAVPAFAQSAPDSSPVCNHTKSTMAQTPAAASKGGAASMAGTSSDAGSQTASGASSAAIATGSIDKTGVNSPCVPGTGGNGSTGALPNSTPNTP